MVGRVVFGALGDNVLLVLANVSRGFEISMAGDTACECLLLQPGHVELRVSRCYLFPDCFMLGVFEGGMAHYGADARVSIRMEGPFDCEYLIEW